LNCEEVRELLSPYLDRELTSDEMTDIAGHLEECPDCMHKSTVFGQLSRVVKHWEGIKASEEAKRKLMEKVRRASTRQQARKTLPVMLLLLLAGALLLGATAALVVWLLDRGETATVTRTAVASCRHQVNRVEVVTGGAKVLITARRKLYKDQALLCNLGAAAQLRWPAGGQLRSTFVLRGPARLKLTDETTLTLETQGTLVFHTRAGGSSLRVVADRWKVVLPDAEAIGLVELTADNGIRVAMLTGSVRLGEGGPRVNSGTEVAMDSGGTLSAPKQVTDKAAFDLLLTEAENK
jgi:anti-sigma factor (TIGR02949 family)